MNSRLPRRLSVLLMATSLISAASFAAGDARDIATIKQALASRFPEVKVVDVQPSPVSGLYEVISTNEVVYVDRTGEYVIAGPMLATSTKANLTQRALDERDAIKFDQLPLDKAIKTVRGNGERTLAVFADPDCPFCHQLEKALADIDNVTIYTFLYPLTSLHPDAGNKAHAIWCAEDRSATWHNWMILNQAIPVPAADCKQDPIAELQELGDKLRVASTPVLFLENGNRISGARPAAQIDALLGTAHADKALAAAKNAERAKS